MVPRLPAAFSKINKGIQGSDYDRLGSTVVNTDIPSLIDIFKSWNDTPPNLGAAVFSVTNALTSALHVNFTDTELAIIAEASKLADEENNNAYHNNKHFLQTFAISALLGADAFQESRINAHQLSILLSAALIHDYKHDGTNNKGEQYRLEHIALSQSEGRLRAAGATDQDWELFKAFIRTTDVSKDFSIPSALSPSETVKIFSMTGNPDDLLDELRILSETSTADIALMLEDADLSGGMMDDDLFKISNHAIAQEQGRVTTPQSELFFLDRICHRQLFSTSGKKLLQPYMDKVLQNYSLQPPTNAPIYSPS